MSISIVSTPYDVKNGRISVKPYFDPNISNLGLEIYGITLYDGVFHEEQLSCIERNGIQRYVTGLNEFAPEVKLIVDKETREAKIKEIRNVVAQLERELAVNVVDPESPNFWNEVKLLKPDNHEFWNKITMRCGNEVIPLDPAKDPYDMIKLYAIEAGGFSMIAPSYDAARTKNVAPKFYLDKYVETISTKTEVIKLKNRAISELDKLFNKNQNKLFYVAKVVDGNSVQYKKTTPHDVTYSNMDSYINGEGIEKNLKRAAQTFLDAVELDMETLKIRAMIKDATFYKIIAAKPDGFIYHIDSSTQMGRNAAECLEFLKNPLQENVLVDITKRLEKNWN
jgi:hypothetical protein